MTNETLWTIGIAVVMVVGLCSVIVPILPGLAIMWIAAVVYGFAVGWSAAGIVVIALITVLAGISIVTSVTVPRKAAAESGASGLAQLGGLAGAVIGFFVIPVVGLFIGGLVGVLVVEYLEKGDWDQAWSATKGTAKGFGMSVLIDLGVATIVLLLWIVWAASVLLG